MLHCWGDAETHLLFEHNNRRQDTTTEQTYAEIRFPVLLSVPAVVKCLTTRSNLTRDSEKEANVESDCETDPPESKNEIPKAKEGTEEQASVVLIAGSFQRTYSVPPCPSFERNDELLAGKPCSSIGVRAKSRSLRSNHRE